jgi:HSP20 family molecular chaperone IbpA
MRYFLPIFCLVTFYMPTSRASGLIFSGAVPPMPLLDGINGLTLLDAHDNMHVLSEAMRDLTDFADHLATPSLESMERRNTAIREVKKGLSSHHELRLKPRFEAHVIKDGFVVLGTTPGLRKEELSIEVTENSGGKFIEIIGQSPSIPSREPSPLRGVDAKGNSVTEQPAPFLRVGYTRFQHRIRIPPDADPSSLKAKYQDGLLSISMQALPKTNSRLRKSVAIQ